jgi:hypothetical protein
LTEKSLNYRPLKTEYKACPNTAWLWIKKKWGRAAN